MGDNNQIPWHDDDRLLGLWRDGQTGYPWIDAAMIQVCSVESLVLYVQHISFALHVKDITWFICAYAHIGSILCDCSYENGVGCTILLAMLSPAF